MPLHDLLEGDMVPRDFYKNYRHYNFSGGQAGAESLQALLASRGNPDDLIWIYRGVPPEATKINEGDWISLSKTYAEDHSAGRTSWKTGKPWKVIKMKVRVRDIRWDANDINEFAYFIDYDKKAGFDPNQPRNKDGEWSNTGGGLKSLEDEIQGNDLETAGVFDYDGNLLFRKLGTKRQVKFTPEELRLIQKAGEVFTHNHPTSKSFSRADIGFLIKHDLKEMRVVTDLGIWSMKVIKEITEPIEKYEVTWKSAYKLAKSSTDTWFWNNDTSNSAVVRQANSMVVEKTWENFMKTVWAKEHFDLSFIANKYR